MAANNEACKSSRIVAGSLESCDIVIKDAKVSKQHCELTWQGDCWQIRDLSSTNGTFVNGKRINAPVQLSADSNVTLGRTITLKIPAAPVLSAPTSHTELTAQVTLPISWTTPISIASSVILTVLLVSWLAGWLGSSPDRVQKDDSSGQESIVSATPASKVSATPAVDPNPSQVSSEQNDSSGSATPAQLENEKPSPYWAILAVSGKDQSKRLIGNAVAVGPHHLITLASITEAMEAVKAQYPKLVLAQHPSNTTIIPMSIKSHPKYQTALDSLKTFEKNLNARLEKVENEAEPSLEESLDWSGKLDSIMEEIATVEVACFQCQETLQSYLKLQSPGQIANSSKLTLVGYPMILPNPLVDQNLKLFLLQGSATAVKDKEDSNSQLMVATSDFAGFPFLSLACTIDDSILIGLVVRQPQTEGIDSKQLGKLVRVEEFWK